MLVKEYRICLPVTVEEYRIAQLYMIQKKSREESTGKESGVEIIKNEPYENGPGGNGQYTFKIYHVGSHLPNWLRSILPSSALRVEEEAWNAYPYTRTTYRVPFVDKLTLDIETVYFDDAGNQDNVFNLNSSEKRARIVDHIDIVQDPLSHGDYKAEEDPSLYISSVTGRGPLSPDWRQIHAEAQSTTQECYSIPPKRAMYNQQNGIDYLTPLPKRIMCAYKLCRVEFRYWGMQGRVEQFIHDCALRKTMVRAHRQVWTWQDEWYGLSINDIRRLEADTAAALAERMADSTSEAKITTVATVNDGERSNEQKVTSNDQNMLTEKCEEKTPISNPTPNHTYLAEDEANNLWHSLKRLEWDDPESMDYSPYNAPDDDALSFVSCESHFTAHTSFTQDSADAIGGETNQQNCSSHSSPMGTNKLVLILVVHGGCLIDITNDFAIKRSDVNTLRNTIDLLIANHYPLLRNRVAIQLVSCPFLLNDTFRSLSRLKTLPSDSNVPTETTLDIMPISTVPLFLTNSPEYPQAIKELASRLNASYSHFLCSSDGQHFNGSVCLLGDSVGSIFVHDLLTNVAHWHNQTSVAYDDMSLTDTGIRRWREPFFNFPNAENQSGSSDSSERRRQSSASEVTVTSNGLLDFSVQLFFMLGSPIGLILSFRQQLRSKSVSTLPYQSEFPIAADQVCNIFHPTDPCGYRIEPLLHARFEHITPITLPLYSHYPLGDSQPTHLVETLVRQVRLFDYLDLGAVSPGQNTPGRQQYNRREKETWLAFEALKEVRQHWWGHNRIDYCLQTPVTIQSLSARSRPPIFHASYWESRDVVAFLLRQLLEQLGLSLPDTSYAVDMDDEVAMNGMVDLAFQSQDRFSNPGDSSTEPGSKYPIFGSPTGNRSLLLPARFRLRRQFSEYAKNVKSNHRANDVVVLQNAPQIITARFIFGVFDLLSMSNEKIHVQTRLADGPWTHLGTELTDSNGRIRFHVPEKRKFDIGLHSVLLLPETDPDHPVYLTLAVVPRGTEVVIFSVDGSFAASLSIMGKDPKVRPGSVDVVRHWQSLGYLIVYISSRPDMQQRRVTSWLTNHNFPNGIALFVEGISTDPLRQKSQLLTSVIRQAQLRIHCAYGSGKDVTFYRSFDIPPEHIFSVGRVSRSQALNSTPLLNGYSSHLATLINEQPAVSKPASGSVATDGHMHTLGPPRDLRVNLPPPHRPLSPSLFLPGKHSIGSSTLV